MSPVSPKIRREADNMSLYHLFFRMEEASLWLLTKLEQAESTTPLDLPPAAGTPPRIDAKLYRAMQTERTFPPGNATRLIKALAVGDLQELVIRVDRIFVAGGTATTKRSIIGVWKTELPNNVPVWLSDATADSEEIASIVGRPVVDATPEGTLEQQHAAIQIPVDIKQSTSPAKIVKIVQGFLADHPEAQRVGVITHREHVPMLKGTSRSDVVIEEGFRRRIAKIEYYRSGEGRGTNSWLAECDLLLVLGTPRVPPTAVKLRLIQTGRAAAATREGEWDRDYWSGVTTTGKRRTIQGLGYRDHDWHAAHRAIVRSELVQAVGRGRGICPTGLPVWVFSNEELGLPLVDVDVEPLSESHTKAMTAIGQLTAPFSKRILLENSADVPASVDSHDSSDSPLEKSAASSSAIALAVGLRDRRTRYLLTDLLARSLVERVGQRNGWKLTERGLSFLSNPPSSQEPVAGGAAGCDGPGGIKDGQHPAPADQQHGSNNG